MLVNLAVSIFAVIIFLFLFWKRLKEDYSSEIIFQSAFYILIGIGLGRIAATQFFPVWFFWSTFVGGLIGMALAIVRFKVRFYETLEAYIISSLPWMGLTFLQNSVTSASLGSFFAFLVILIILFFAYWVDTHYKGFGWYKSGKVGFTGLAVAIIFFLVRSLLAISKVPVLSFVGRIEGMVSGVFAFVCSLLLYNLGRYKK